MTMKKHAYYDIINFVEYERPHFHFPEPDSENANPFNFWPMVKEKLYELGFKKEALVFSHRMGFMNYKYEDIIQLVSYFLDFNPEHNISNKNNIVKEDNDYVYIKVKKEMYYPEKNLKQPSLFKIKDVATFREMMDDEDFSIKNCYGRTFLHYISNPLLMSFFLEKNKEKKWIDLFDVDVFHSSYLHSASDLECFGILFKAMSDEDTILTKRLLFSNDVFEQSGYQKFINLLTEKFSSKETIIKTFSDYDTIKAISDIFVCLKKVDSEEFEFLKNQFYTKDLIVSCLKANPVVAQNVDKMFLLVNLENSLETDNQTSTDKIPNKSKNNKI